MRRLNHPNIKDTISLDRSTPLPRPKRPSVRVALLSRRFTVNLDEGRAFDFVRFKFLCVSDGCGEFLSAANVALVTYDNDRRSDKDIIKALEFSAKACYETPENGYS